MSRPFSVLLVEDDDPLRSVLLELLRQRGWHVHAAARGDDALEIARRVRVDFSILDLHLPGLNGVEVYRRIASEIRPVPSILMSGGATGEETRRALEEGIVEFLRKPLDLHLLRRTLDQLVRLAERDAWQPAWLPARLQDLHPRPSRPVRRRRP